MGSRRLYNPEHSIPTIQARPALAKTASYAWMIHPPGEEGRFAGNPWQGPTVSPRGGVKEHSPTTFVLWKSGRAGIGLTDQLAWWRVVSIYEAEPSVCRHNPTIPHLKHNVRNTVLSKEILAIPRHNQSYRDFQYRSLNKPDLRFKACSYRLSTAPMTNWAAWTTTARQDRPP